MIGYRLYVKCQAQDRIGLYSACMAIQESEKSRRDEYTEATRSALLAAGEALFARDGYQAAGIEAISRAARVTRGAFYHHFADKLALFDAVVVSLQASAAATVQDRAKAQRVVWNRLRVGIDAYLDVCLEPTYLRVVVQEAPAILGPARHRAIEEAYPLALLVATLEALKRSGELDFHDVGLLARMLDAMICKVALMLPDTDDPRKLRRDAQKIIGALLDGFRRV